MSRNPDRRLGELNIGLERQRILFKWFGPGWREVTVGDVLDRVAVQQATLDQLEAERRDLLRDEPT